MIGYFADNMWLAWVLLAILCLILELASGDFFIMCFAIGALCSMLVSLGIDSIVAQIIAFAVFSIISILFVRPVVLRYLHRKEDARLSNADALIGRQGKIVEAVEQGGYGRVQIDGDYWKAKTLDGSALETGMDVEIIGRESIIVTVKPI